MTVEIRTPGTNASYEIPVMKSQNYTVKEIFEKKLLFLIPFHIFTHEHSFKKCNQHTSELNKLKTEYETTRYRLEELLNHHTIDEYTKCTIIDMSNKVLENIAQKYENVKKGVKEVMGGKILDYEAKKIKIEGWNEGRNKGRNEGRNEGKLELLFELVKDNILSTADAAARANVTETVFREQMQYYNR